MITDPNESEARRLAALNSYDIMDSVPEEEYDAITRIAAQICNMPISTITLVDDYRQWFKSSIGMKNRQTPREQAFCAHAIQKSGQLMEVHDARTDSRFADNPLTTGEPHIRFYAGVPLVDESGQALGTLCVIDNKPNKLSDQQATALKLLARQVVTLLQLRRSQALLKKANQSLHTLNDKLQESNHMLQTVVDNCPAGLVLWQAIREAGRIIDFRYVFTNPANALITGLSVDEMTGGSLKTLFPGVTGSNLFERLVTVVETGQPQRYQQLDRFNQIDLWGNFTLTPLGDGVLFAVQDITRLKKAEDQLRAHTENLEQLVAERTARISQLSALQNAILEHAGLAILSTDLNGVIQTANPVTETLFGYRSSDLIGWRDVTFLFDPAELESQAQALSNRLGRTVQVGFDLFKLMINNQGYECTMISRAGQRIPILLTTSTLKDKADTIIGYVAMATDITALKKAKAELKKKNQELNTFFDVALDLHCIASTTGAILKTNRAWQTTLGYTEAELLTMNYLDLVHPDDREATQRVAHEINAGRTNRYHINRFCRQDGTYRVIEWHVVGIDNRLYASARDITERQQAARELKRLNQRLNLATQAAELGVWEYDYERDLLVWDTQLCAIHGVEYTGNPLQLNDYRSLIHPDDMTRFNDRFHPDPAISGAHYTGQTSEGTSYTRERRIIRPDGVVRYTELFGIRKTNKAGKLVGSVGVIRDITERKQAELALRQSEERYRLLVDNLKEVVFQTNPQGEWTFLNPFWTIMLGYTVDESLGKPFYAYVSPGEQEKTLKRYAEFIEQRRTSARFTVRYRHKAGMFCWAEVFAQVLTDETGRVTGTAGTFTDITEQKKALDALRESEQRFRDIAEHVNEVFWMHAIDPFRLLYVNPAYTRLFSRSLQSLYDDPASFIQNVVEADRAMMTTAFEQYKVGKPSAVQYRLLNGDGQIRWVSVRTFVVKNQQGTPLRYIGVASDITSQKEEELMLQQSLEREQELNRLKSQFVATASHEFRTPLATIQSSVDLIKMYSEQSPAPIHPAVQRHLGIIEKEIANFSSLLAGILTLGRIEAGKIPFNPQQIDVLSLTDTVISTHFSERADRRTVQLTVMGTPRPIYADEKLLSHALVNLLSNAFKFSTDNPALGLDFAEDTLTIRIHDTGIGIPAEDMGHLFDTFFRAGNAVNIQGSGLGLVITRQFIEQHSGQLTIRSQEHVGTTCIITLPV